mgnify:CR=1 FL=1
MSTRHSTTETGFVIVPWHAVGRILLAVSVVCVRRLLSYLSCPFDDLLVVNVIVQSAVSTLAPSFDLGLVDLPVSLYMGFEQRRTFVSTGNRRQRGDWMPMMSVSTNSKIRCSRSTCCVSTFGVERLESGECEEQYQYTSKGYQ